MKRKVEILLGMLLIGALIVSCGPKPSEIALNLAEAVNAQDLDSALALFAEDAVVTSVSPEPFNGKAEIRGWLEGMFADNFTLEIEVEEVDQSHLIEYDTMTMDSMSNYGIDSLTGTSEIYIEDGKIKSLTFNFSDETLEDLQAAPFVAPQDLIGIWSVGTVMKINEDGTLRVANTVDDLDMPIDADHPGSLESWSYDGMVLSLQVIEVEGIDCTPDQVGHYYVKWIGEDLERLRFSVIEDECAYRVMGMQWGNWAPVAP